MVFEDLSSKICIITVTYGERFAFLKEIINSFEKLSVKVDSIIIVDNASSYDLLSELKKLNIGINFKYFRFDTNRGSAAGYKKGIEIALENRYELFWLLDDDNKPQADALEKLLLANSCLGNNENFLFTSYRSDRIKYFNVVYEDGKLAHSTNSFIGFNVNNLPKRIFGKLRRKNKLNYSNSWISPLKKIDYSIYGGLLLKKKCVETVGFPDEKYFTYIDDTEFTTRLSRASKSIYLVASSIIEDIDSSWHQKSCMDPYMDSNCSPKRAYYTMRNSVFFWINYTVSNKFIFYLNMLFYLMVAFLKGLFINKSIKVTIKRFKLIINAIEDGILGKMGYREEREALFE